jgi:hypothetical protein
VFPLAAFVDDIPLLSVEAKYGLKAIEERYGCWGAARLPMQSWIARPCLPPN